MSYVIPTAFFDPPIVLDCTVTPIPKTSDLPMQVIADSGIKIAIGVNYQDTTGDFIGVYTGIAGQEQLICIIGNGTAQQAWGRFPAHSRVSLRSMTNQAITAGLLQANLVAV